VAAAVVEAGAPVDDLRTVLDEELDRLPARLRLPVVLCYLEGRSTAEAAARLGCPRGTVLSRLAAARAKLRARLARRGLAPAAGGLAAALAGSAHAPAALVGTTVRAALAFTAGRVSLAGLAAPAAVTLAEGVLNAMFVSKLTVVAAVVLAVGALGAGAGLMARPAAGPGPMLAAEPRAANDDAPAKAAAEAPRKAAEDEQQAANERLRKQLAEVRVALDQLEVEQAKVEEVLAHKFIEARMAVLTEEDRLQRLLEERAVQREPIVDELRKVETRIWNSDQQSQDRWRQERNSIRQTLQEFDAKWSDRILDTRKKMLMAEEALKLEDRRAAVQRQRLQSKIDAMNARLAQLQGIADRPAAAPDRRHTDLDGKLDALLAEVKELRRELRK
jgi:hypothetical protein